MKLPTKTKTGRKKKQPPPSTAKIVRGMAAGGYSLVGIARELGTSKDTLLRWLDEQPELREAYEQGKETERYSLHNMLYRQAMQKGNATAAMFLLKSRHGYREGDQTEQGNRVSITFALPGALGLEEYKRLQDVANKREGAKVIEHATDPDK
jgi:transposase-like protein